MKKISLVLAALFLSLTLILPVSAKTVIIAIEGLYNPFNYVDKNGKPAGFEVDLAKAICKEMGVEYKFIVVDWNGMIPGLIAGKMDIIMASMSITEERKKAVAFSNKYYVESGSFTAAKNSGIVFTPEGIKGKRIGVQKATTWNAYVEGAWPGAQVVYYDDQQNAFLDLFAGRLDMALASTLWVTDRLKDEDAAGYEIVGPSVEDEKYIGVGIGAAMKKSDVKLMEQFNQALDKILKDGTYQNIAKKYFAFDIYGSGK